MPSRSRTIGIALVAVVTLSGCLDDGVPDLESGPVLDTLDRIAGSNPSTATLASCPVGEFEELIENSVELVDEPVVRAALDGATRADLVVVEQADGPSPVVRCEVASPGGTIGLRLAVSPGEPSEHERFAAAFEATVAANPADDPTSVLSDRYRGGEFVRVCVDHRSDADDTCSVDWVDRGALSQDERATIDPEDERPRALVGLTVRGPGALDLDLRLVEERWRLMLPLVIQRLE